jgi:hypothetical protein
MTKSNDVSIPILIEDNKDSNNLMKTVETLMKQAQNNDGSISEMKIFVNNQINKESNNEGKIIVNNQNNKESNNEGKMIVNNQINFPGKKAFINEQIMLKKDPNKDPNAPIETKQSPKALFTEIMNAEKIDVCFLVDCTGSMTPYINMVKSTLNNIVEKLKMKFKLFEMRVSFVGYRDHADGDYRITCLPFTDNVEAFKSFVSDVKTGGGADQCEVSKNRHKYIITI